MTGKEVSEKQRLLLKLIANGLDIRQAPGCPAVTPEAVNQEMADALAQVVGVPGFVIIWIEEDGLKMNFGVLK